MLIPMKARPHPILRPAYKSMFDRIKMNIVEMFFKVLILSYQVFPISALPNSSFPLSEMGLISSAFFTTSFQITSCKHAFYQAPAFGIIAIVLRQAPDAMQIFRQKTDRLNCKWMLVLHILPDFSENPPGQVGGEEFTAIKRNQSKKI